MVLYWIVIGSLGLVTYTSRVALLLGSQRVLPARVEHTLKQIPAAVLTAIIAPSLLLNDSGGGNVLHKVMAGAFAGVIALATKNVLWTAIAGMVVYLLLDWVHF